MLCLCFAHTCIANHTLHASRVCSFGSDVSYLTRTAPTAAIEFHASCEFDWIKSLYVVSRWSEGNHCTKGFREHTQTAEYEFAHSDKLKCEGRDCGREQCVGKKEYSAAGRYRSGAGCGSTNACGLERITNGRG